MFVGRLQALFAVYNFGIARTTLTYTLMNNPVPQFGHWNPENADM